MVASVTARDEDCESQSIAGDGIAPSLKRVLLVLTSRCNLKCAYCFQNAPGPSRMAADTVQAGIRLAVCSSSQQVGIVFTGGEPLLEYRQIGDAVDYAERILPPGKSVKYWLITNGLLLSAGIAGFLQEHRFKVQLSFDGVEGAQRGRGAHTFKILDRLLDSLRTSYPALWQRLHVTATVTPRNVRFVAQSISYFLGKEVTDLSIAPVITHYPGWENSEIARLDAQFTEVSDQSWRHLLATGKVPLRCFRKGDPPPGQADRRSVCSALRGSALTVDVDGQVYGCPLFVDSYQDFPAGSLMCGLEALRMGHIEGPDFPGRRAAAVRAAEKLVPPDWAARRYSSLGRCCDCPYQAECSICPVSIWSKPDDTDPLRVPDFVCAFNRVMLKHRQAFPHLTPALKELLPL
jgi:sulfatase maturation enzyme AslB (radical SAM superfamily)